MGPECLLSLALPELEFFILKSLPSVVDSSVLSFLIVDDRQDVSIKVVNKAGKGVFLGALASGLQVQVSNDYHI